MKPHLPHSIHRQLTCILAMLLSCLFPSILKADNADDLAAKAQNPIASMISIPLDTMIDFGADNGTAVVSTFQPVIPMTIGNWNFISRPMLPIIYLEGAVSGLPSIPTVDKSAEHTDTFGLGDLNYSLFISPAKSTGVTWGIGPSITIPTATDDLLGSGKWSIGPTAVILVQPKPWTMGLLARNLWDFAGDGDRAQVNQFMFQYFVNYNLDNGWYLTTDPIMTANWGQSSDNRWTIPVGGGIGRLFTIGEQPINMRLRSYYNVDKPTGGAEWSLNFAVQLLFPK